VDSHALPRSYRALLRVPSLGRILLGMQVARIAGQMVAIAIVLFTLDEFHSAALAGVVTFAGIFPGLLASPIAGALLDRHGRSRLIVLDYLVALASLALIGVLGLAGLLTPPLLVAIAAVSSLTAPLSATGLRSLFPLLVPRHLWERVNAVDSNGYVLASVAGPPVAGALVQVWGGPAALIAIASVFGLAAIILARVPDPDVETASTGRLLTDAWQGVVYTWRNPTLRGLGFSISILNIGGGMTAIVVPLIVLDRLHGGGATVGAMFAILGVGGMIAAFASGRLESHGRERRMLVWPMLASGGALALLLPSDGPGLVALSMALIGLLNGPLDIALFTLRQRRTDPAWTGRAFAVSMAFNFAGFPIGSAFAGWLAAQSVELAIVVGVVASVAAAIIAQVMIPAADPEEVPAVRAAGVAIEGDRIG
jgi:MFS family permease